MKELNLYDGYFLFQSFYTALHAIYIAVDSVLLRKKERSLKNQIVATSEIWKKFCNTIMQRRRRQNDS